MVPLLALFTILTASQSQLFGAQDSDDLSSAFQRLARSAPLAVGDDRQMVKLYNACRPMQLFSG